MASPPCLVIEGLALADRLAALLAGVPDLRLVAVGRARRTLSPS
jgi:hypothetical protein